VSLLKNKGWLVEHRNWLLRCRKVEIVTGWIEGLPNFHMLEVWCEEPPQILFVFELVFVEIVAFSAVVTLGKRIAAQDAVNLQSLLDVSHVNAVATAACAGSSFIVLTTSAATQLR
jgi:hypothetical protein